MATNNEDYISAHQKRMAKKKAVANELLALRRMKLMQQKNSPRLNRNVRSPKTGHVYEAYKVVDNPEDSHERISISREQVRTLIKGTTLEKELHDVYGEDAIDDAADHYTNLVSMRSGENSSEIHRSSPSLRTSRGSFEEDTMQRKLFLHKLLQDRKSKLEEKRHQRYIKEQALLQQKKKIQSQKSKLRQKVETDSTNAFADSGDVVEDDSDSSEENLNYLVNEVKQNIGVIERRLRHLKQQRLNEVKSKKIAIKPPAIDYSFKPWQQEQVKIAKDVVNDIIAKVLDICVYSGDDTSSSMMEALLRSDNEKWEEVMVKGMKHDAMLSAVAELTEEVIALLAQKVAEECTFLAQMTNVLPTDLIINSSYAAQYGKPPKATEDPTSKLIDQTYMEMTSRRDRSRKSLWSHTQPSRSTVTTSTAAVAAQPKVEEHVAEESEGDITPISYELTPLRKENLPGPVWGRYVDEEFKYWATQSVTLGRAPVSLSYKSVIGISCLSVSYDNRLIALGTFRGDIQVYDITWEPFRPIRCVSYVGKSPDRIMHVVWSLDGSRLLTLSESFCLFVWSVSFASPPTVHDIKNLSIPDEKNGNYKCQQFTALVMLEAKFNDFTLKEGTLATSVSKTAFSSPVVTAFAPTLTLTGTQNNVVVGFASGDILKLDLTSRLAARYGVLLNSEQEKTDFPTVSGQHPISRGNKIAQGIEVELFRNHRHPILLIHFLNNNGDMISIDEKLNLCQWKYNKDQLTGFNWFTPYKKFKISGTEQVMVPKGEERVIFEDEITLKKPIKGKRRRGKQLIERERQEVMLELRTLHIQDRQPWHSDDQDIDDNEKKKKPGKFVTRTYAPRNEEIIDPMGDQLFHIVTKQRSTNTVVKYTTQVYQVTGQPYASLADLLPSRDGSKIYFMFLHDKHLPNIKRHATFVDLDLSRMDMLQSSVIKLNMNQEQFEKCMTRKEASFTVSSPFLLTRSEYIFCNLAGRMHIFSTKSGSRVAWCTPDKKTNKKVPENGLELPVKLANLNGKMKLKLLSPDGNQMHLVVLTQAEDAKTEAISGMVTFANQSTPEQNLALATINNELYGMSSESAALGVMGAMYTTADDNIPLEQCIHTERYTVRHMPTELYIRMTLNSLIDNAVAVATGERMTKEQRSNLWKKDWNKMQSYFQNSREQVSA